MKIGIIGYGDAGRLYGSALARAGQEVVRVADPASERLAEAVAALPRVGVTTAVQELSRDPGLDAVLIATPLASRFPLVYEALETGKHVLVDGPLATSEDEASCLAELAGRRERALMAGQPRLHGPGARRLRELMADPAAGPVLHLDCQRSRGEAARRVPDLLFGVAAQEVARVCFLLDRSPTRVQARAPASGVTGQLESLILELGFDGGPEARIEVTPGLGIGRSRLVAVADRRRLVFDESGPVRTELCIDSGRREVHFGDPLRALCESFADCAEGGDRESPTLLALGAVQILEAARRSLAQDGSAG